MTFDPKLIGTFVMVAEELSFSRAAARLGVAQPWISERVRRLEEQLQLRLINRTSRRVELTREGQAMLPLARQIVGSVEAVEQAATELRHAREDSLSVATLNYFASYPERQLLIDRLMEIDPPIKASIHWATVADKLVAQLASGQVDLGFASLNLAASTVDLEALPICTRIGHLMIPTEHPLSNEESVSLEQLRGCSVVVSPGRTNQYSHQKTLMPLVEAGLNLVPAPEGNRKTIEHFARIHRMIYVRWRVDAGPRVVAADMTHVPISGNPLRSSTAIWRRRESASPPVQRFWTSARTLARIIHAGPTDPDFAAIAPKLLRPVSGSAPAELA